MKALELLPAISIALLVIAILIGAQLMPFGKLMLLVRVPSATSGSALAAATLADAAFVGSPAPGFAVLYGNASRVRRAMGLAVAWTGAAPCASRP